MQTFRPIGNRVLVQRLPDEEKTASGIIIPDNHREKPNRGIVKAVGPGATGKDGKLTPMEVNVADVVIFPKYAGNNVKLAGDDSDLLIMSEDEIMGILRDET